MEKKKIGIGSVFYNNKFVLGFSIVVAIIFWFVISIKIGPEDTRTIEGVSVSLDKSSVDESMGMKAYYEAIDRITVVVEGKKYAIANLTAGDIILTAPVNVVNTSGYKRINIEAKPKNAKDDYTIVSCNPSYIDVYFDEEKTEEIPIEPLLNNLTGESSVEEGYIQDSLATNPPTATVTGPATFVNQIEKITATAKVSAKLTRNQVLQAEVSIIGVDGKTPNYLTVSYGDVPEVTVTVTVLKSSEVPLKLGVINGPVNMEELPFHYTVEPDTLRIAGPEETITNLTEITIGPLDLATLSLSKDTYTYPFSLPSSVKVIDSDATEATVKLDLSNLETDSFTISGANITVTGKPADKNVEILSTSISNVTIMGPKNVIRRLENEDVHAVLDLSTSSLSNGEQSMVVKVTTPDYDTCWAIGTDYKVYVSVTNA